MKNMIFLVLLLSTITFKTNAQESYPVVKIFTRTSLPGDASTQQLTDRVNNFLRNSEIELISTSITMSHNGGYETEKIMITYKEITPVQSTKFIDLTKRIYYDWDKTCKCWKEHKKK